MTSMLVLAPDFISSSRVSPSAFDLLKSADGLLLAGHRAAGNVEKADRRLRVDGEVQEERDALAVGQDAGLGRALRKLLDCHQRKPDFAQNRAENGPKLFSDKYLLIMQKIKDRKEECYDEFSFDLQSPSNIL